MRISLAAAALAAALLLGRAEATVIDFSTTGSGAITVFAGLVQESRFVSAGCPGAFFCASSVDATEDVPTQVFTHRLQSELIGINDGNLFGPSTDFSFSTEYAIGGQSVVLIQTATFFQIANGLFQLKVNDSVSRTLDLGAVGLLDVKALGFLVNLGSFNSGGGAAIKSNFLLHDVPPQAVPEPATWAMLIGGFGMIGGVMRRRKVHAAYA